MSRLPKLPEKIKTPTDVLELFGYLTWVDKTSFHPDDRFWDEERDESAYVTRGGGPSYTKEEAQLRDRLMGEAFEVVTKEGLDIYELALWVTTEDLSDAPKWVKRVIGSWRRTASMDPSMNGRQRRASEKRKS